MGRWKGCVQSTVITSVITNAELLFISRNDAPKNRLQLSDYVTITQSTVIAGTITGFIVGDNIIANSVIGVIQGTVVTIAYSVLRATR